MAAAASAMMAATAASILRRNPCAAWRPGYRGHPRGPRSWPACRARAVSSEWVSWRFTTASWKRWPAYPGRGLGKLVTGSPSSASLHAAGPAERVADDLADLEAAAGCPDGVLHLDDGHPPVVRALGSLPQRQQLDVGALIDEHGHHGGVSREKLSSRDSTTGAWSGIERVASAHAAQVPGGSQAPSSSSTSWHSRARRKAASCMRGGRQAASPSSARNRSGSGWPASSNADSPLGDPQSRPPSAPATRLTGRRDGPGRTRGS